MLSVECCIEIIRNEGWTTRQAAIITWIACVAISRNMTGKRGAESKNIFGICKSFPGELHTSSFFYSRRYRKVARTDVLN